MSTVEPQAGRPEPAADPAFPETEDDLRWLSALADGQADALERGLAAWRRDPEARARWHSYHLIGDVLRSEELAQTAEHDAAFLARLRVRLADEPVPLAPAPLATPPAAAGRARGVFGLRAWGARLAIPTAVAAGFLAVAAALLVTQQTAPERAGGIGFAQGPMTGVQPVSTPVPRAVARTAPAGSTPIDSTYLRNAELDRYLEAHSGALGGSVVMPGGGKRLVDLSSHVQPAR